MTLAKRSKACLIGLSLALCVPELVYAQPTVSGAAPASPASSGLAPDGVVKQLSDLVHAGKYAEAQQLIPGLLLAYPKDRRLVQAKALLDKLLATANATKAPDAAQPANVDAPSRPNPKGSPREFVGIGAQMEEDPESHKIRIADVFPNSPASKAGISGFAIDKVDGTSTVGKSIAEVARLMTRDRALDTQVTLGLIDERGSETTVVLTRQLIQIPDDTSPTQLTGVEKVKYNALLELARQAQQTSDLQQQRTLLRQFMAQGGLFLGRHPGQMLLWQFRLAAALSLNDPINGYDAGQRLLAAGAADSNDPNLLRLLGQLENKGWIDKQSAERHAKSDWLVGTWSLSWSIAWPSRGIWPANHGAIKQSGNFSDMEVSVNGSKIDVYYPDVNGAKSFFASGVILESGAIQWSQYYSPAGESFPGFHTRVWGREAGKTFYPSGWQPIISVSYGKDLKSIAMVVQSQDTSPTSEAPLHDTVTLLYSKISDRPN